MVEDFKILVGTHGAATIVFLLADNVDFADVKRVGSTDDGANIKIVFDVFDGDFERCTLIVQGYKNLFVGEAFVFVDEVPSVFHCAIIIP